MPYQYTMSKIESEQWHTNAIRKQRTDDGVPKANIVMRDVIKSHARQQAAVRGQVLAEVFDVSGDGPLASVNVK